MSKFLRTAMLPTIGAALLAAAMFTVTAKQAEATHYAVAYGSFVTDCGPTPAEPCPGEPQ